MSDPMDLVVLKMQRDDLAAALQKVLDTREKEAKAHTAYQTALDNFSGDAAHESRQHLATMRDASAAEREAWLLLLMINRRVGQ